MQAQVQVKWAEIEKKLESYQKEYQNMLEQIIEEVAQQKYEEMAEIKAIMKKIDPSDEEALAEKKDELEQVKVNMDKLKESKINEAKEILETRKKELEQEKKDFFTNMKSKGNRLGANKFTIDMSPIDRNEKSEHTGSSNHSSKEQRLLNLEAVPTKSPPPTSPTFGNKEPEDYVDENSPEEMDKRKSDLMA